MEPTMFRQPHRSDGSTLASDLALIVKAIADAFRGWNRPIHTHWSCLRSKGC